MIRYALRCDKAHTFDSWFGSSADFDRLLAAGHVSCAICGSPSVTKELMAPAVSTAGPAAQSTAVPERPLSAPASPAEQAVAELRRKIEAQAENVGRNFASEARRIHSGEAPQRPIIGEARPSDAKALLDEGIPVAPLPWSNRRTS